MKYTLLAIIALALALASCADFDGPVSLSPNPLDTPKWAPGERIVPVPTHGRWGPNWVQRRAFEIYD